jgi:hypothetical protein
VEKIVRISTDENFFTETTFFMIETLEIEGTFFNMTRYRHEKPTANMRQ